ncbi:hypothetical protein CYY_008238 [Polysphondylium violaceum]|uniref:Protein FRA10AC1 n=1 Tax=Polysphondylium violaceum TaxID=133409 RepID=A0A8J4PN83_9MYCE|nr:hypothetical protein CYY_008238 [Polysphondylium violaceum]
MESKYINDLQNLDAITRHNRFIQSYLKNSDKNSNHENKSNQNNNNLDKYKNFKSDYQILKENYKFIRDDDDDNVDVDQLTWEDKLAIKYYNRLYKEYAIIDLSRYKTGEIGLRWRVKSEVISGRGQFTCANRKCENVPSSTPSSSSATTTTTTTTTTQSINNNNNNNKIELKSYEVPFSYLEDNQEKTALVKKLKQILKEQKKEKKKEKKRKYSDNSDSDDSDSNNDDNSSIKEKKRKEDDQGNNTDTDTDTDTKSKSKTYSKQEFDDFFEGLFV